MRLKVIGIDISDETLSNVTSMGGDATFNSRSNPNYASEIHKLTGGGAGAVAVFSAAAAAYRSAPPVVRLGGLIMVAGLPEGGVTFDALDLATGKYRVKGDSTGIPQRMRKAVEFTAKHGIKPLVELHESLEDVAEMVEKMKRGQNTRRMVVQF